MEAARRPDAEPWAPLRVPSQGLGPGPRSERQGDLSNYRDSDEPRAARGLFQSWRQEQLRPSRRARVGFEERWQDRRSRRLRPLLQPDEHAIRAVGDPELPAVYGDHPKSNVSGPLRRPRSDLVRCGRGGKKPGGGEHTPETST